MDKNPEKTLAANLAWLMENTPTLNSQKKIAVKAQIDQKTVSRVMRCEHSPQLDKLTALAKAFGLEAWQLIAPRLGADLYKIDAERRIVPVRTSGPAPGPAAEVVELSQSAPPAPTRKRHPRRAA